LNHFSLKPKKEPDLSAWKKITRAVEKPKHHVKIALVGKYVELHDAYISVRESLKHACLNNSAQLEIDWINSCDLEKVSAQSLLSKADGIIVPGGFGVRGTEGMIVAAKYARENNIPYLGLCLGFQIMVIEFARYLFNDNHANSTEFDEKSPCPVIDLLPGQKDITNKGGTMRLGLYPCKIDKKTIAYRAYRTDLIKERHRHRFELNNRYREQLETAGMVFSGKSPDGFLVEIGELTNHPFMLGSQFHPEFLSRPNRPHPLFNEFIKAVIKRGEIK
jgi:CTP synthase